MTLLNHKYDKPILVIEDSEVQQEQIRAALEGAGFTVLTSGSGKDAELNNYKAIYKESQLVVVDLDLNTNAEPDPFQGYRLIKDKLWPADRTTIFIVYSKHDPPDPKPIFDPVGPMMATLRKRFNGASLSPESLNELVLAAQSAYAIAQPALKPVRIDPFSYLLALSEPPDPKQKKQLQYMDAATHSLQLSLRTLQLMTEICSSYAQVGSVARHVGVAVYGSCGRLEMRDDSDLEFSVLVDSEAKVDYPSILATAGVLWNRTARTLEAEGITYEGQSSVLENVPSLLAETQYDEELPNGYRPLISTKRLFGTELARAPHLRNRHYQILFEARPAFNPTFLLALKRKLIDENITRGVNDRSAILGSTYFQEIQDQFLLDAAPRQLDNWKDVKRFCLRTGNILAMRIGAAVSMACDDIPVNSEEEWTDFFDWLSSSGVMKLVRASKAKCTIARPIQNQLVEARDHYGSLMGRFANASSGSNEKAVLDGRSKELRGHVRVFAEAVRDVLETLSKASDFRLTAKLHPWVFSVSDIVARLKSM